MAISIIQHPLYSTLPVGQQIIFSVNEPNIVASKFRVKFTVDIHISNRSINLANIDDRIGTYKTTPNNQGVGIFDIRSIVETFVSPDNVGIDSSVPAGYFNIPSEYKSTTVPHPIHVIDHYAVSPNCLRYCALLFKIEYSDTAEGPLILPADQVPSNELGSASYLIFNGVLQFDDILKLSGNNYGYDMSAFQMTNVTKSFLTNSPIIQYARLTDYGTLPFLNFQPTSNDRISSVKFRYYDINGSLLGAENPSLNSATGASQSSSDWVEKRINYVGAFPGNLRNWSTLFNGLVAADTIAYYTVQAFTQSNAAEASKIYTINIKCPNEKGYEGIRLTWLNQWGTWDYYTFNMKSTRTINTKRTPYTQLGGTWNLGSFKIQGYKGGKKNFRVNSKEKIKMNTDFVTEEEAVWFQELINSSEVYTLTGYTESTAVGVEDEITYKYVQPVTVTTSSFIKKTIANDKLIQYNIEVEKSRVRRTQSV